MVASGSPGERESRNHSTSMGAPRSSTCRPARSRRIEERPSAATTRSARTSKGPLAAVPRTPITRPASSTARSPRPASRDGRRRSAAAVPREEVEEVPLRHEGDELAAGRQMREVGDGQRGVAELGDQARHLLVGQAQELLQQAQLVHQLERGGVDGVAPEVAEEVGVLLEHQHRDAGAGEQEPEHHAGGAAARHAARHRGRSTGHGAPMLQCPRAERPNSKQTHTR